MPGILGLKDRVPQMTHPCQNSRRVVLMLLIAALGATPSWGADTKSREAESAYAAKWPTLVELLRRREYSNAAATLDKLAEATELQYARPLIDADKEAIAGLQTLTRLVFEEAARLETGTPLNLASIEYTFVAYRENPKGDELVLKSKATGRESTRGVAGLPATTWLQLVAERKSDLKQPALTFGVFVGFDQAADVKTARKFFDEAAAGGVNVTHWLARLEAPATPKPAANTNEKEPVVVSTWAHQVNKDGNVIRRQVVKLYSNGHINTPTAAATWTKSGNTLILNWPAPDAPGGKWVDVLTLSPNGKAYIGKNQRGFVLRGTQLAAGDIAGD